MRVIADALNACGIATLRGGRRRRGDTIRALLTRNGGKNCRANHPIDWGSRTVLLIHNLSQKPQTASFNREHAAGCEGLMDLFAEGDFSLGENGTVTVGGYGCRWLRVRCASGCTLL